MAMHHPSLKPGHTLCAHVQGVNEGLVLKPCDDYDPGLHTGTKSEDAIELEWKQDTLQIMVRTQHQKVSDLQHGVSFYSHPPFFLFFFPSFLTNPFLSTSFGIMQLQLAGETTMDRSQCMTADGIRVIVAECTSPGAAASDRPQTPQGMQRWPVQYRVKAMTTD